MQFFHWRNKIFYIKKISLFILLSTIDTYKFNHIRLSFTQDFSQNKINNLKIALKLPHLVVKLFSEILLLSTVKGALIESLPYA